MSTPLELPRPHGEGPPVPPMWQATLDSALLAQLFMDLSACAEVHSVQGKADPKRPASRDPLTLDDAQERLASGGALAVQIRYRYDGHEWTDTIARTGEGFRLIRCRT